MKNKLNTMESFKNGFGIERDSKIYTLTAEEMFDFRYLDNAWSGQNCLDNYRVLADDDEVDVIDQIRNDEKICYNLHQDIMDDVLTDTESVEYEMCQKYIKVTKDSLDRKE